MDEARIKELASAAMQSYYGFPPNDADFYVADDPIDGGLGTVIMSAIRAAIAEATAEARRCPCGTLQENVRCKACMAVMTERAVAEVASEWAETLNAKLSVENERLKAEIRALRKERR